VCGTGSLVRNNLATKKHVYHAVATWGQRWQSSRMVGLRKMLFFFAHESNEKACAVLIHFVDPNQQGSETAGTGSKCEISCLI
jgi:hypothetical protein